MRRLVVIFGLVVGFGWWLGSVWPVHAAAATIFFGPNPAHVAKDQDVDVGVFVSTDTPVNSLNVTVSYELGAVVATTASPQGNFPVVVVNPQPDNSTGTVNFRVGAQNNGYLGTKGQIGIISFRGVKVGTSNLTIKSAEVIACTGSDCTTKTSGFVDIYAGSQPGTVVVDENAQPQFTTSGGGNAGGGSSGSGASGAGVQGPVPVVNSPTHPDPSKWYTSRNVTFTWGGGIDEYNYTFDQTPDTIPPASNRGSATTATMSGVGDGIWYIHVRAGAGSVWGPTTTFKVQIDGSPPEAFSLKLDQKEGASTLPLVTFSTKADPSGIDFYEVKLDDGDFVKTVSPYQVPQVNTGKHTVEVRVTDKAGNQTSATASFSVEAMTPTPKITTPTDGGTISLGSGKTIEGTGPPNSFIQLYANDQFVVSVKADSKGKFKVKVDDYFDAGKYTFTVKAAMPRHLDSAYSKPVKAQVTGLGSLKVGGVTIPGNLLIIIYVLLILALIGLLIWLFLRWRKSQQEEKLAVQKLQLITEPDPSLPNSDGQPAAPIDTGKGGA